jgi:hypothetical protein
VYRTAEVHARLPLDVCLPKCVNIYMRNTERERKSARACEEARERACEKDPRGREGERERERACGEAREEAREMGRNVSRSKSDGGQRVKMQERERAWQQEREITCQEQGHVRRKERKPQER